MIVQFTYYLDHEWNGVVDLHLILDVTEARDPYGTGDSPTQLEVEFVSCVASDGNDYDFSTLHKYDVDKITELACDKHRGY